MTHPFRIHFLHFLLCNAWNHSSMEYIIYHICITIVYILYKPWFMKPQLLSFETIFSTSKKNEKWNYNYLIFENMVAVLSLTWLMNCALRLIITKLIINIKWILYYIDTQNSLVILKNHGFALSETGYILGS